MSIKTTTKRTIGFIIFLLVCVLVFLTCEWSLEHLGPIVSLVRLLEYGLAWFGLIGSLAGFTGAIAAGPYSWIDFLF